MLSKRGVIGGAVGPCLADVPKAADAFDPHARSWSVLLAETGSDLRDTASSTGRDRFGAAVLTAIAKVLRHRFVLPQWAALA